MLDRLEAQLPGMIAADRTPGKFWNVFTGEADLIKDQAGELDVQSFIWHMSPRASSHATNAEYRIRTGEP